MLLAYPTTFTPGSCTLAKIVSVVRMATRIFDVIGTILTWSLRSSDYEFARLSLGPKHHFGMSLANSYCSTPEKTEDEKAKTDFGFGRYFRRESNFVHIILLNKNVVYTTENFSSDILPADESDKLVFIMTRQQLIKAFIIFISSMNSIQFSSVGEIATFMSKREWRHSGMDLNRPHRVDRPTVVFIWSVAIIHHHPDHLDWIVGDQSDRDRLDCLDTRLYYVQEVRNGKVRTANLNNRDFSWFSIAVKADISPERTSWGPAVSHRFRKVSVLKRAHVTWTLHQWCHT